MSKYLIEIGKNAKKAFKKNSLSNNKRKNAVLNQFNNILKKEIKNILIQNGINGVLFNRDDELVDALLQAVIISQATQKSHDNLLPNFFHQQQSANQYLNLVEGN